jgi:hypothetical protein
MDIIAATNGWDAFITCVMAIAFIIVVISTP